MAAAADPDNMACSVAQNFKDYSLKDGMLFYQNRVVVPDEPAIKQELLSEFHDSPAASHQGKARTLELIARHYYWPAMKL